MRAPLPATYGSGAIGIGGSAKSIWRVSGEILRTQITMKFRANDKDEAIRQAHARGMTVDTCEMTAERN